jgi:predicted transcriptional regulator
MTFIEINATLKAQWDQLAAHPHRTAEALIHDAVTEYLARAQTRAALHREADAAWAEFQNTGLHLTGEEVEAWLETWGTESEAPPPPCHT